MELSNVMSYPPQDALDIQGGARARHRKALSTGGGRAWSESEEAYLLQTRLQKMPYKHIAAHLNKTELACRLHYHQISHGGSRRRRNLSFSSAPADYGHRRVLSMGQDRRMSPAPRREETSPASATASPSGGGTRLPSIMSATGSSKPPALLPKPNGIGVSGEGFHGYGYPEGQMSLPRLDEAGICEAGAPARLNTAMLPSSSAPQPHNPTHVDLARLQAIYAGHRNTFWAAIASEYGYNAAPSTLEQAWRTGQCCGQQGHNPMTPSGSPVSDHGGYRASVSSMLGPDARACRSSSSPSASRDPWDRDMIRKMEITS